MSNPISLKVRPDRNQISVWLASMAAVAVIVAPVLAIVAIWTRSAQWLETAGAVFGLAVALYAVAWVLFDEEPKK